MQTKTINHGPHLPHLKDFKHSLFWNLFDSVGTQGLLILYHLLFRNFFGAELHGRVGCTLSVFYLCIIILNAGLDYSLAPFLDYFTKSRRHFRSFVLWLILPQICFLSLCVLIFYAFFPFIQNLFSIFKTFSPASALLLLSIGFTFLTESIKKTFKYLLQLSFYTPLTAIVEVVGMIIYMLIIFLSALHGIGVTLEYTWQALGIVSAAQLLILTAGVLRLYTSLGNKVASDKLWHDLPTRIMKTRVFAWSNQCMQQLFSGNFLVPICALHFGLEQASLMKVITSISYWITLIAQKVFGVTGNALLAHVKTRSLETQRKAFEYISFLLTQALYFLVIFLIINGKKIALLQAAQTEGIRWSLLYFMLILSFFECFFIIYEKWYILEEKASIFFLFNLISFGALYTLYPYVRSTVALLMVIITIRLLTFFVLTLFSFYRWKIWPSLKPEARALALALFISAVCYVLI